jgi:Holliday junction DNA helicase RuvA
MYEFVTGRLVSRRPDRAVVEAAGVGWRLLIPLSTYERLPRKEGAEVRLWTVHYQREDRQALYGFATEEEREYFETLYSVTGVGPALALALVSALPFEAFRAAVVNGDAAALTRVRGVGRKVAGRLLLELAEAMKQRGPVAAPAAPPGSAASDAALALVALGFDRRDAEEKAGEAARALGDDAPPGEVVRRALRASGRAS